MANGCFVVVVRPAGVGQELTFRLERQIGTAAGLTVFGGCALVAATGSTG